MDSLSIIIETLTSLLVFALIPFVGYCVVNITTLKTDMRWVIGGLKILGDKAGVMLHSPHSPEFDHLIELFWHNSLDKETASKLSEKLEAIVHEDPAKPLYDGVPYSDGHKAAAAQMLMSLKTLYRL